MKSVYIITGGILVMIAVVLLAPKKKTSTIAEEKPSSQLDEIDAFILKEYGDDLSPADKECIAEQLALEKAEMRKYGRILTPDERSERWWREQDEAEERAAWTEFYAERKDWIDNFPFQPRYHQNMIFDPENIAHSDAKYRAYREERQKEREEAEDRYDRKTHEIWSMGDEMTTDEKHEAARKLWQEVEESGKHDPEIMAERRVIDRHKRLAGFYAQDYRYLPEFEQAYRIFEEEGAGDNPIRIANTMLALEGYFVTRRQANQHGLDELHPFQTRTEIPPQKQGRITIDPQINPPDKKTYRRRITWKEELESEYSCIAGNMMSQRNLIPGEENITREQAYRIRERLVAEIPADGFTGNTFLVGMMNPKDEDMVPGQSLLAE